MQALKEQRISAFWNTPILIVAVACFCVFGKPAHASFIEVLPPQSTVAEKTIGEWTAEWWKWAYSISLPYDPFSDATGAFAGRNQSGSVFFLAKSPGTNLSRSFSVPEGKHIPVPLIAGARSQAEFGFDKPVAELRQFAEADADLFEDLLLIIDGVNVANLFDYREVSPEFEIIGAPNNIFASFGGVEGKSGIAVQLGVRTRRIPNRWIQKASNIPFKFIFCLAKGAHNNQDASF